ncbi:MAG: DUF131 domain-containing protein, partial [Desulfurococcales archaeon]|nr:DUF131 domain-containing protein [Desulfurococcales archaeon]
IGMVLIFVGFIMIMLSLILSYAKPLPSGRGEAKVSGGGVVIVGPVPIVFGTDKRAALAAAVVGAILTIIVLFVFLITSGYIHVPGGVK